MIKNTYYYFSGQDLIMSKSIFPTICNNFTYEFWIKAEALQELDVESITGTSGIRGKRYVIGPGYGGNHHQAGIGISIGMNGISVYEHAADYFPATLVYGGQITGWKHIAVVYQNKQPLLFIDGKFIKAGLPSPKAAVFASGTFGGLDPYGYFVGCLTDIKLWNYPRTEEQIKASMNEPATGNEPGLAGYWRFENGNGVEIDSTSNSSPALVFGASWRSNRLFNNGKIGIIMESSQYDATRHFGFDLAKAFMDLNYQVEFIDLLHPKAFERLEQLLEQPALKFLMGMNGHGIAQLGDRLYRNQLTVPFLCYFVDHPMYHLHRFTFHIEAPQLMVSCVDMEHIFFLRKYCNCSYANLFLPQAAMNPLPMQAIKPINLRNIEILFAGTNLEPDAHRNYWLYDIQYAHIMEMIAEKALYTTHISLPDIAEQLFNSMGIRFSYSSDFRIVELLHHVDLYIRGRRRNEIIHKLSSLPMKVITDQPYSLPSSGNIQYMPPVDIKTLQAWMYDSKIVLNVLANLVYGAHERIFTAMQAGAVCLTDSNRYITEHYTHKENILLIDYKDPHLGESIGQLLGEPDRLQAIADRAQNIVPEHTWYARARSILHAMQLL